MGRQAKTRLEPVLNAPVAEFGPAAATQSDLGLPNRVPFHNRRSVSEPDSGTHGGGCGQLSADPRKRVPPVILGSSLQMR